MTDKILALRKRRVFSTPIFHPGAVTVAACVCALVLVMAGGCQAAPLTREHIVLLIRHGVRPPTHEPALSPAIAPDPWPTWDTPDGDLTPHGAAAIRQLAAYDRQLWAAGAACPSIDIYADLDERTLQTGAAFAAGLAPGCAITVRHAAGARDPLFSGHDDGSGFDSRAVAAQMLQAAGGNVAGVIARHRALFQSMQDVLQPGGNAFLSLPGKIAAAAPPAKPKLSGPIAEGASGAEDFLLEYLEGKPMRDVAWGRADPARIATLLALHPLAYTITARPAAIAHVTAAALARRILADLTGGPAISVLVGHDTNQAELAGLLHLHWHLGGYPADDPPPGGGLVFILSRAASGAAFVTLTYQTQTMDQVRYLTPLNPATPPAMQALPIPGCGDSVAATACSLPSFQALLRRLAD